MLSKLLRPINVLFHLMQRFPGVFEYGNISQLTCVLKKSIWETVSGYSTSWTTEVFEATGKVTNVE